ncbi:MAG TPA: HAMP domain-containing histidine kinase, partial [Nitrospirae bacterium]|nr:HAMP domain-containing histidine kinase [Nitrospirota bacterium]
IEQGVFESNLKECNLSHIIDETVVYMKPNADKKDIIFEIIKPDFITVFVDDDLIRQLLINLLFNAIKFSPSGSKVIIDVKIDGKSVITSIIDEGTGVEDKDKNRIFDKFYKKGDEKEGSGLGLSISKSIVEFHDGMIGVKDREDGKSGACFYVILPILN